MSSTGNLRPDGLLRRSPWHFLDAASGRSAGWIRPDWSPQLLADRRGGSLAGLCEPRPNRSPTPGAMIVRHRSSELELAAAALGRQYGLVQQRLRGPAGHARTLRDG